MNFYMCLNCTDEKGLRGKKFWGDKPVCSCGVDDANPEYSGYLQKLVVTHYEPPHPVLKGKGTKKTLCGVDTVSFDYRKDNASGSPAAVSCPACLAHAEFPHEAAKIVPHVEM